MKIKNHPPSGESFIWLTRELLSSDAWRSQSIHTRRLIDFLLLEYLRRAGQTNGRLKAPYRQLYAFGIGAHFAPSAILRAEELGLVACAKAGMRTATTYRLTWLESHDGMPPTNEWRGYRNPDLPPLLDPKIRNLHVKQHAGLHAKQHADGANLHAKQHPDSPKTLHAKQHALYRISTTGKRYGENRQGAGAEAPAPRLEPTASTEAMITDTPMDKDRPTKPTRERPVPYERRAQKPGAGIVAPSKRPPASAKLWSNWNLAEAKRQGQGEMFAGDLGETPRTDRGAGEPPATAGLGRKQHHPRSLQEGGVIACPPQSQTSAAAASLPPCVGCSPDCACP
jgi:hypothetical protein